MEKIFATLTGKLLLAMPGMNDPRFYHSVIFICNHDAEGSMGLIINQSNLALSLGDMLEQLHLKPKPGAPLALPVQTGGPVESGRGFLIHTLDFEQPETMKIDSRFGVTATLESLQAVADGSGPRDLLFVLGYAGWTAGQLEQELQDNAWMVAEADHEVMFNTPLEQKWDRAMGRIGVDPGMLSTSVGRA